MKSWLDYAMMKYGGSYLDIDVEEVKTVSRIMLIFATLIPYWTIYFQVQYLYLPVFISMGFDMVHKMIKFQLILFIIEVCFHLKNNMLQKRHDFCLFSNLLVSCVCGPCSYCIHEVGLTSFRLQSMILSIWEIFITFFSFQK